MAPTYTIYRFTMVPREPAIMRYGSSRGILVMVWEPPCFWEAPG